MERANEAGSAEQTNEKEVLYFLNASISHNVKPGCAFFKGPIKFLPSSGVAFKVEFSNKEITKAHSIEKIFYAFN